MNYLLLPSISKRVVLTALLASSSLVGVVETAVAQPGPRAGQSEVEVGGNLFRPTGTGSGNFNLAASYGKYLDDPAWQVGVRQSFNYTLVEDDSDFWTAITAPYLEYHFIPDEGGFVPFLGAFTGVSWNDDDFTGTAGPSAGFKVFLTESTHFFTRYKYEWFFDELESDGIDRAATANNIIDFGLGYRW